MRRVSFLIRRSHIINVPCSRAAVTTEFLIVHTLSAVALTVLSVPRADVIHRTGIILSGVHFVHDDLYADEVCAHASDEMRRGEVGACRKLNFSPYRIYCWAQIPMISHTHVASLCNKHLNASRARAHTRISGKQFFCAAPILFAYMAAAIGCNHVRLLITEELQPTRSRFISACSQSDCKLHAGTHTKHLAKIFRS